jgi:hypothetical protein
MMRQIFCFIISANLLISCSKQGNNPLPDLVVDTSILEPKITIFSKSQCNLDTIVIRLQAGSQIKQIEHRLINICNGDKFNYKVSYSYDTEGRLITVTPNNQYTVESRVQYYYATKVFTTGLSWDTATAKKTGISKIRIDLKGNYIGDYNHLLHDGDSVILLYNWTRGRTYVGTVGTWDASYGISGTAGNIYPIPNYPEAFQRYTDYLWNVDTNDLILSSVSSSGNAIRSFQYNASGQLIYADYKKRSTGGAFGFYKQMDITWDTATAFLPPISKAFKDAYWIGNTEFPLFDPIYKFDIENGYGFEAATDINFIFANMKSIDYDFHSKSYTFENTYTNRLLTHKIMRNNMTGAIAAEFTITYSF